MTEVFFTFDTEDYTSPLAWDASVREANLLKKYGIKGNFNVVGYLAREWMRNKRYDVPETLKEHVISFHSLRHSYHPTICEYTDLENYNEAKQRFYEQEMQGMGMVKAATGVFNFPAACPPGNSLSYVAMYGYAELDIPLYLGSVFRFKDGQSVWFCNGLHTNYDHAMESTFFREDYDLNDFLEKLAAKKRAFIYTHPTMSVHSNFWDLVNYKGGNLREMHRWDPAPRRTPEETEHFFAQMEKLIAALKNYPRFVIRDTE